MNPPYPLRRIRSFVRRDGRITTAQRAAFEQNWPALGLNLADGMVDFFHVFQREAPRILEIGFGSGVSLQAAALAHPDQDFIGIETHQPGIGALMLAIQQKSINNIRIYYADAVEVLENCISPSSLDVVQIFFPDPWPKRKHHKRRLIQPQFVNLVVNKLKSGGALHLATDWEDYAIEMLRVLSDTNGLVNMSGQREFAARSGQRPIVTKFERRGQTSGRQIWELQFAKIDLLGLHSASENVLTCPYDTNQNNSALS